MNAALTRKILRLMKLTVPILSISTLLMVSLPAITLAQRHSSDWNDIIDIFAPNCVLVCEQRFLPAENKFVDPGDNLIYDPNCDHWADPYQDDYITRQQAEQLYQEQLNQQRLLDDLNRPHINEPLQRMKRGERQR